MISACVFLCALLMLCLAQLSAARGPVSEVGAQTNIANVSGLQVTDSSGNAHPDAALTQVCVADLSSELSEPMLPQAVALAPWTGISLPAVQTALILPHPLIEGPQRPPRDLRA